MNKLNIQRNVQLSKYANFKVGGPANYFCDVYSREGLKEAFEFVKSNNLEYLILSGGTNLIISDDGFNGLVIKINFTKIQVMKKVIQAEASTNLNSLVDISTKAGLKGLEWAGGLPGELGGAVRGNAGAFKGEIKDIVREVISMNTMGQIITRNNSECNFGYRTSIFKSNGEVILSVKLEFNNSSPPELVEIADSRRAYRSKRHPIEYPSVGSIFKNVPLKNVPQNIKEEFEKNIKIDPFPVIPTAAILDRAGLSGYQIGGAQISTKHPNYIVNIDNASTRDIISVIQYAIAEVKERYSIDLEVEPQLVGFASHYKWESN